MSGGLWKRDEWIDGSAAYGETEDDMTRFGSPDRNSVAKASFPARRRAAKTVAAR